jgi:hypothetical protein
LTVTAVNKLNLARPSALAERDPAKFHVRDSSGKALISQTVDTDYEEYRRPDLHIFQADFAPYETKAGKRI